MSDVPTMKLSLSWDQFIKLWPKIDTVAVKIITDKKDYLTCFWFSSQHGLTLADNQNNPVIVIERRLNSSIAYDGLVFYVTFADEIVEPRSPTKRFVHSQARVMPLTASKLPEEPHAEATPTSIATSGRDAVDLFAGFDPDDHQLMKMDGYDDCIAGVVVMFGKPAMVCYSQPAVIKKLMADGMDEDEANEFFEFNQLGAYVGSTTPCFLHPNANASDLLKL